MGYREHLQITEPGHLAGHIMNSFYESTGEYRLDAATLLNVHPKIEKLIPLLSTQTDVDISVGDWQCQPTLR